jgi:hypothetical protein
VKKGKMALLGHPYSNHMPLVPGRTFALSIPGAPTHGPLNWPGDNFSMTFMDELLTAEIGQVGTEQADGFFTRGILIDIAALKDVKVLDKGYAITLADFKAALQKQGITDASHKAYEFLFAWAPLKLVGATGSPGNPVATY